LSIVLSLLRFLGFSKPISVDGLWIRAFCGGNQGERTKCVGKAHDLNRNKRAIASFDRIWVSYLFGAVGQYVPELRRCQLEPGFFLSLPTEPIAATIVHKAAHARFINVGIPYKKLASDKRSPTHVEPGFTATPPASALGKQARSLVSPFGKQNGPVILDGA
jgi:hypothetical protein